MISRRLKTIFVHIPKTGGTSVENVIWPGPRTVDDLWMGFVAPYRNKYQTGGLQHLLAKQIRAEVGNETFSAFLKFTIVRNPWDKAISQYKYLRHRKDLQAYLGISPEASLARYLEAASASDHVQVCPQYKFILDDNGEPLIDVVCRFETIERDVNGVFERLGLSGAKLPHQNKSDRDPDYRVYYNDETRQRVADIYSRDISMFGYSF